LHRVTDVERTNETCHVGDHICVDYVAGLLGIAIIRFL